MVHSFRKKALPFSLPSCICDRFFLISSSNRSNNCSLQRIVYNWRFFVFLGNRRIPCHANSKNKHSPELFRPTVVSLAALYGNSPIDCQFECRICETVDNRKFCLFRLHNPSNPTHQYYRFCSTSGTRGTRLTVVSYTNVRTKYTLPLVIFSST